MGAIPLGSIFGGVAAYAWEFDPATKALDVETATREELTAAYRDCAECLATEYPETDKSEWASRRISEIVEAFRTRGLERRGGTERRGKGQRRSLWTRRIY